MKWWQWCMVAGGFVVAVVVELVSWSLPSVAFSLLPSVLYGGILANTVRWPTSLLVVTALGGMIDLFAPAPFGVWMIALVTFVIVTEWVKTTWLKQLSVLSVFVAGLVGLIVATLPFWFWLILSWQSTIVSPVIQLVPWWHWPIGWLSMSIVIAVITRLLPSPYERLL